MAAILPIVVAFLAFSASQAASIGEHNDGDPLGPVPHFIGGNYADPSHSKYTVELTLYKNKYMIRRCGAARFNKHWFVTAAECLDNNKYDSVQVTVPHDDPHLQRDTSFIELKDLQFKLHQNYNPRTKENNIALFRNKKTYVNPKKYLSLPTKNDAKNAFVHEPAVMSAWVHEKKKPGQVIEDIHMSVLPTRVEMPQTCKKQYPTELVEKYHICVVNSGNTVLTQDDVGIPLVDETRENPILIGIGSSIAPPKKSSSLPMVFLKITPYREWIHKETGVELGD